MEAIWYAFGIFLVAAVCKLAKDVHKLKNMYYDVDEDFDDFDNLKK